MKRSWKYSINKFEQKIVYADLNRCYKATPIVALFLSCKINLKEIGSKFAKLLCPWGLD
jgi:hypothetical protein